MKCVIYLGIGNRYPDSIEFEIDSYILQLTRKEKILFLNLSSKTIQLSNYRNYNDNKDTLRIWADRYLTKMKLDDKETDLEIELKKIADG